MLNYNRKKNDIMLENKRDHIDVNNIISDNSKTDFLKESTKSNKDINTISISNKTDNLINDNTEHHKSNIIGDNLNNKIIVETDFTNKSFTFYDSSKNILGVFNIYELIKYITSNVSTNFLTTIDSQSAKPIIEKYICNISVSNNSTNYVINMKNWLESPFMGNIYTLVKLYTLINNFEKKELQHELNRLEKHERENVQYIYNKLIYNIISHILKVISILNRKMVNNHKVRQELIQYSILLVHRLTNFHKREFDNNNNNISIIKNKLKNISYEKQKLKERLEKLEKSNNISNIDSLVSTETDTNTMTDISEIYDIQPGGNYVKYKNTESIDNCNFTLSELGGAIDRIRTSSASNYSNVSSIKPTTTLMDMISLNNSVQSSDNFFHSDGDGINDGIQYLSSNQSI